MSFSGGYTLITKAFTLASNLGRIYQKNGFLLFFQGIFMHRSQALGGGRTMDLLERDHCFKQLSALLHLAMTGQGRTVLISGEAGIGKTVLVEQFVNQQASTARWL